MSRVSRYVGRVRLAPSPVRVAVRGRSDDAPDGVRDGAAAATRNFNHFLKDPTFDPCADRVEALSGKAIAWAGSGHYTPRPMLLLTSSK